MVLLRVKSKASYRALMPHQDKYVKWGLTVRNPACFMEMRLGKTLASIRLIQRLEGEPLTQLPILVVAPVTVLEAWEKELTLEDELFVVAHGLPRQKRMDAVQWAFEGFEQRRWILLNYESLRATPELALLPWFMVALDESTAIKNPESQISAICCGGHVYRKKDNKRYRITYPGFPEAHNKTVLSGLPAPESELDLFQQFKFLYGSFMGCQDYWHFKQRYFHLNFMTGKWEPRPGQKTAIKNYVHHHAFVMRRSQAGMGSKKIPETRTVIMSDQQKSIYQEIEDEFAATVVREDFVDVKETDYVIVQRTWLARVAGGCDVEGKFLWDPKIKELMGLLRGELSTQPVVVWFRFNAELLAVADALRQVGIPFQKLLGDGSTRDDRKRELESFRQGRSRVLLVQIKLGKMGLDMSVSRTAIYYSMGYSCEEIVQSEDRILNVRIKEPLLYVYLVSSGTVDEDVVWAARTKSTNARFFMTQFKDSFIRRREAQGGKNTRTSKAA